MSRAGKGRLGATLAPVAGQEATWAPVASLQPWADNPRTHGAAPAKVARSIERFGWGAPMLARAADRRLIAGHGRMQAVDELRRMWAAASDAERSRWHPDAIRVVERSEVLVRFMDLTDAQAQQLALADNRTAQDSEWNEEILERLIAGWQSDELALGALGFDDDELERLLGSVSSKELVEDDPPPPPKVPITRVGDVWTLGDHRLVCGDSAVDWGAVVGRHEAAMTFTDPPYGVEYVGRTKDALTIKNDGADDLAAILSGCVASCLAAVRPGGAWYVCAPPGHDSLRFGISMRDAGVLRQRLVWVKDRFVLGRSDYHYRHEDIYYGWSPGAPHRELPDRTQDSVWEIPRPSRNDAHPTMKPIALCARAIANSSARGDLVWEPFGGSGSTLIACEQLERSCRVVEIDPAYCDVIVERWENLTGRKAARA